MTEREKQLEVEAEEYLRENLGKRPTEEIIKYLIGVKEQGIRRLEKEGGEIPGTELISFGDDQYVEITNLSISLLNRLQTETGFHKSEIIEKALEKFVISRYTEDIDNKLENRPDAPVSSNTRFENSIPKNKLESGYKRAIPKQNDEHSIMVKGLIPMLQNKIFPVIFLTVSLNLKGWAVPRTTIFSKSLIFFAAPNPVAVCGSTINLNWSFIFLIINSVVSSLILTASKSFFISWISLSSNLKKPFLDKWSINKLTFWSSWPTI